VPPSWRGFAAPAALAAPPNCCLTVMLQVQIGDASASNAAGAIAAAAGLAAQSSGGGSNGSSSFSAFQATAPQGMHWLAHSVRHYPLGPKRHHPQRLAFEGQLLQRILPAIARRLLGVERHIISGSVALCGEEEVAMAQRCVVLDV
jgi:hypothetical protein